MLVAAILAELGRFRIAFLAGQFPDQPMISPICPCTRSFGILCCAA